MPLKSAQKVHYHAFSNSTAPLITHISDNFKAESKTNSKKYTCYRLTARDLNVVFELGPQCRQDLNVAFFWDLKVGDLNVGDLKDLNTKLVWYSNGRKEVGCQMVWFLNTI